MDNWGEGKGVHVRAVKVCRRNSTAPPWQLMGGNFTSRPLYQTGPDVSVSYPSYSLGPSHYKGLTKKIKCVCKQCKLRYKIMIIISYLLLLLLLTVAGCCVRLFIVSTAAVHYRDRGQASEMLQLRSQDTLKSGPVPRAPWKVGWVSPKAGLNVLEYRKISCP